MKKIYKYLRLVNIIGSHKLLFSQTQYIFSQFSCTLFFYYTYCLHRRRISCFIKDLISFFFQNDEAYNQAQTSSSQSSRHVLTRIAADEKPNFCVKFLHEFINCYPVFMYGSTLQKLLLPSSARARALSLLFFLFLFFQVGIFSMARQLKMTSQSHFSTLFVVSSS